MADQAAGSALETKSLSFNKTWMAVAGLLAVLRGHLLKTDLAGVKGGEAEKRGQSEHSKRHLSRREREPS